MWVTEPTELKSELFSFSKRYFALLAANNQFTQNTNDIFGTEQSSDWYRPRWTLKSKGTVRL